MTKQARFLMALLLCCAMLVPMSATASAAPAATGTETTTQAKAKIKATLLDHKVKVNAKARIRGDLDLGRRTDGERGLELVVVQRLVAGAWVDVGSTSCRPSGSFRLSVSFSVAAQYSLRVYHPSTAVFSSVLSLSVVL